ncbi:hypothetical protein [Streptomyces sp. NPDC058572]|uniref:hypothetical protein n=1 Tax=Streptomyces sp. NPDC058572 TaxID=3346546 RepID=UPI003664A44C
MERMRVCEYCEEPFTLAATGRPPKFCSSTCRKNAWYQARTRQEVALAVTEERRRIADALGLNSGVGGAQ